MTLGRWFSVAAVGVAAGLSLSGCESLSDPTLADVHFDNSGLSIAICRETDAVELILERRVGTTRIDLWSASGHVHIAAGQVLTADTIDELFEQSDLKEVELPAGAQLTLIVRAESKQDNIVVAFDADRLTDDGWLRTDDSVTSDSCSSTE